MINNILKSDLFRGAPRAEIAQSLPAFEEIRAGKGEIIFRDGARGDCLYLILSGKVRIVKYTSSREEVVLGELTSGRVFGELDVIDNRRRSAGAVALTECRLLRLAKRDFLKLMKKCPGLGRNLLVIIAGRLRASNLTYVRRGEGNILDARMRIRRLESLNDAAYLVYSSLNLRTLLTIILDTAAELVKAGRGTLYLIDEEKRQLWSHVETGSGSVEIRLALGEGIAGHVARTGEVVNLTDAYSDPRFNPDIDRASGFVSRTMLCTPLRNRKGKIIGVLQLLNKSRGSFDAGDEAYIEALSVHAASAIENARLAERMIHEERLSAVGRMAGAIVHDIKNPLSVLKLSAEFLSGKISDPECQQITRMMIEQIDRFNSMAQEIIEFSRGTSSLKIRNVETSRIIETVIEIYSGELGRKGIDLRKDIRFSGDLEVDFDKIVRCLQNVIGNALDAMPRGGTLGITTGRQGPFIKIEITDTGPGIPEEIKSRIFEPFVTSGKRNGTGLGLPIVKKIAEDHGGKVEVESVTGKGTTVRISLPEGRSG